MRARRGTADGRGASGRDDGIGARVAERFYRALLRLYPRTFRREFEPDLVEAFHVRRRSARERHGAAGGVALWLHILRDLAASLPGARRPRRGAGRGPRSAGGNTPRRAGGFASGLGNDLRWALRHMRRQPGFAAVIIGIMALGISGTTLVFSVVDGVLLRPLPYPEPDRVVRLWANLDEEGITDFSFTKIEFRHFFDSNEVFESIGGDFPLSVTVTGDDEPERLRAAFVTPGYFETYGALPTLGRWIDFDDIDDDNLDVVVISHGLWQRRLGGRDDVIGETLVLDDRAREVIGVLPESYRHVDDDYDVFVPYTRGTGGWTARWLGLSARLAPGATLEQARANVDAMMATVAEQQGRNRGWRVSIDPLDEWAVGGARPALLAIFGAIGLVLLLACVNVANLLLARASTRRPEIAVRLALGAGRGRIVRQYLVEGLMIATAGGIVGAIVAYAALPGLLVIGAEALPRLSEIAIDTRALAVVLLTSVASGALFGLAPAWHAYRAGRGHALAPASTGAVGSTSTRRIQGALITAEVMLALVVLVGAGLMLRSFWHLQAVEIGVEPDGVVSAQFSLPGPRYPDAASVHAFYDELLSRVGAMPGVESASLAAYLPLDGEGAVMSVTTAERLQRGIRERIATLQRNVRRDFFRTLGIPLLHGRTFDERRGETGTREVIISQSLAETLWPGEDPVGKRVTSTITPEEEDWNEVVGVVGDVRYVDLESEIQPQIYESHLDRWWRDGALVVRTALEPSMLARELRRIVNDIDPQVPVADVRPISDLVRRSTAEPRFSLLILAAFALLGVTLASAGIYGVIAFAVGQRRREIGVRKALGATNATIVARTVADGMAPVVAGLLLGATLSTALTRTLHSVVFEISPLDPLTYAGSALLMIVVALVACWLPSRRAARTDPAVALDE